VTQGSGNAIVDVLAVLALPHATAAVDVGTDGPEIPGRGGLS
jgi:hypothetical protein